MHDGEERYTTADIAIVQQGCRLLERGFPLPELLALAREHTAATRDIAEQAVALFDEHVRQPLRTSDLPDDEKAEQLVEAFRVLLPDGHRRSSRTTSAACCSRSRRSTSSASARTPSSRPSPKPRRGRLEAGFRS